MTKTKNDYRNQTAAVLKTMPPDNKKKIEAQLREHLFQLEEWKEANVIGITISQSLEWDTEHIIRHAWQAGKRVAVPKAHPSDNTMTFFQLDDFDELEVVYYNLWEPKPDQALKIDVNQIDVLIVPGLVFDKEGYRIGFGGGYYDRFLQRFEQPTVSLLSSEQLVEALPRESHDRPVDILLTEEGVIKRRNPGQ